MSFFKKGPSASEAAAGGGDASMFGVTLDQLKELMQLRGKEFTEKLNSSEYNGVNGILEKLKVDKTTGLHSNDQQDLAQRRTAYGKNVVPRQPQSFFSRLTSPHEREFRRAQEELEKNQRASVVRDNLVQEIPATELVVGDLCVIKSGDFLPVDGLVVEANHLKIDDADITGESNLADKSENGDAVLFSGIKVMEGSGRMVVLAVGPHSQVQVICDLLRNA